MAASDSNSTARLTTVLTRIQLLMIVGSVAAVGFLAWQVGPLLKQRDELKGEIKTATAQLGAVKTELQALESQRRTLQDDIAKLKTDNRENETRARAVARQLQQAGFIVPSIQRVAAVPSTPQLRYFRPADVKDAERAITVIRQQIPSLKAVEFENQDLTRKTSAIRPRHLELWF